MSTRTKTQLIGSRAAFEIAVDTIAQLQLEKAAAVVARDEAKEAVLKQHEPIIKGLDGEIKALQSAAQAYAQVNWEHLAPRPKAKTSTTELARYGFRTGQPTVKLIGKGKESDVARDLHGAGHIDLVHVTYKLDKKRVLQALAEGVDAVLRLFRRVQGETFYVEAKAQEGE